MPYKTHSVDCDDHVIMQPEDFRNYCREYNSVAKYRRNMRGTVGLSLVTILGAALFAFRFWPILFNQECSWALIDRFFVPPFHYVVYFVMIYETPEKSTDTLCLLGRIAVPCIAFSYYLFMIIAAYLNNSPIYLAVHSLLILVHISLMLPETVPGVKYLRPFLRRPEKEIEEEKFEIVKKYEVRTTDGSVEDKSIATNIEMTKESAES